MGRLSGDRDRLVETFILPSGMKAVCCRADTRAEYFGVAVNTGSRDEAPGEYGLAHFVEHTIFKGTTHRRSGHIINRMEGVGGELNAFTSKEETYVYAVAPAGNLARGVDLIADLCMNSVFPAAELEKERAVVGDEIDACLDAPAESVFDDFEDLFFYGSQLGHNILGSATTLQTFGTDCCRRWAEKCYTACRMTVFYLGPEPPEKVVRLVERYFRGIGEGTLPARFEPAAVAPFRVRRQAPSHQANTVVGARIGGMLSSDRYAMGLLINILGGPGMNSRLNVSLRERRGLVYSVEASASRFTDCGLFTVYYGCDPEDNDRCLELVYAELSRIASHPLSPRALENAKRQYLGQLVVASDNMEQSAMNMARSMMYRSLVPSPQEVAAAIISLTSDDILRVAHRVIPDRCSSLTLG